MRTFLEYLCFVTIGPVYSGDLQIIRCRMAFFIIIKEPCLGDPVSLPGIMEEIAMRCK
jgi:hypothetical protein